MMIQVYEGNMTALDLQLRKFSIFHKKSIDIEGEKIKVYVDADEFQALIDIAKLVKENISENKNEKHYQKHFPFLFLLNIFDNKPTLNEIRAKLGFEPLENGDVVLVATKE